MPNAAKKPLNQERRLKERMKLKPKKERGQMPPPTITHKNKRDKSRQEDRSNLKKEYVGMNSIAREILVIAKSLVVSGRTAAKSEDALIRDVSRKIKKGFEKNIYKLGEKFLSEEYFEVTYDYIGAWEGSPPYTWNKSEDAEARKIRLKPDYFEFIIDEDDIQRIFDLYPELDALEEMGADFDFMKLVKKALRTSGKIEIDIKFNVGPIGSVYLSGTYMEIKTIDVEGITIHTHLGEVYESDILEYEKDYFER